MNSLGLQRRLTGAFINTHRAQCSIFESGVMVAGCLAASSVFDLHCTDLDEIDLEQLRSNRRLVSKDREFPAHFDFWVFNWHYITMAGHIAPSTIAALEGLKFTVVLELAEEDPLVYVPKSTFDGYLALDPSVPAKNGIFPFPRPLQGTPLKEKPRSRAVPVIGSFGFGTPGKGFELLVEAVNREFDRALVRINVPIGAYISPNSDLARSYANHMAAKCRQIAKPGVEVQFTHEFLGHEALIDWCHDNDLNCFMYTRDQPGLSATTDQAILSGQPLLTLTNGTFRHIHPYIPPYPSTSLREAMGSTATAVASMQRDWSKSQFCSRFESMLAGFVDPTQGADLASGTDSDIGTRGRTRVLVLHRRDGSPGDLLSFATRFTNAVARPATRDISKAVCDTVAMAIVAIHDRRPNVVVALDQGTEWASQLAACFGPQQPFLLLDASTERRGIGMDASPPPIIPFFTCGIPSPSTSIAWLIGFEVEDAAPLCRWFARVANETRIGRIVVEAAQEDTSAMALWVHSHGPVKRSDGSAVNVEVRTLPDRGDDMIRELAAESVLVFHAGIDITDRTQAICSLALCTEQAVVFDPAAPLPAFGSALCLHEGQSLQARIELGITGQIAVVRDYGEWATAARWLPRIDGVGNDAAVVPAPDLGAVVALSGFDRLDEGDFVRGLCLTLLGRDADNATLDHQLDALWMGHTRTEVAVSIGQSGATPSPTRTDGDQAAAVISNITKVSVLQAYLQGWLVHILSLDDSQFVRAAYRAGLGRDADPDGLSGHRALIESGESRFFVLNVIVSSPEAKLHVPQRLAGVLPPLSVTEERGAVGAAWVRHLFELDAPSFLEVACRFFLGRPLMPDEFGPEMTSSVRSRLYLAESLWISTEGTAWLATCSASPTVKELSALTKHADTAVEMLLPREVAGPSDDRVSPKVEVHQESSSAPFFLATERTHPVLWVLTETVEDGALRQRLSAAKDFTARPMVAVAWNRTVRRLERVVADSTTSGSPLFSEICRAGDWLVLLGGFGSQADDLPEMDVLMTARTLGLRSACVFDGAGVLEHEGADVSTARACERHMQALLLTDLILPVSNRARDEIVDVFVESQRAREGPPIVKLPLPIGRARAADEAWDIYARKLRGLLIGIDCARNGVGTVLYLDCRSDVSKGIRSTLPMFLKNRGVTVIELAWKGDRVAFAGVSTRREVSDLDDPRWILIDGTLPSSSVPAVRAFAREWRASVAAITPAAGPQFDFRPFFGFDRVLAGTEDEYRALTAQLLETRERLPEAELRFRLIERSHVRRSEARPGIAADSRHSVCRFAVIAASGSDQNLTTAVNALSLIASASSRRIEATVFVESDYTAPGRMNLGDASVHCSSVPNIDAALRDVHAALVLGDSGFVRRISEYTSWVGVPVIVSRNGASSVVPGAVSVDFDRSDDVERVLLRLLDDLWRSALRTEALLMRPRTDEDYADEILQSLVSSSDVGQLTVLPPSGQISIYARLPALERRPLLSVCISTYNRAGWLALGLKNLFEQIGTAPMADVEVVVVDNAATDTTPQVVQPYLGRPDFRYYRNSINVGMLGNLAVTAQRSKGSYVWIIGDDDLTQPGAVKSVLSALRNHPQLAMVYVNYGYTTIADPSAVGDLGSHLSGFNVLEPEGPDALSTVAGLAASCENFYTAIYACVFQRSHALRAFCQDTSGRPFSTMLTCVPTAYYALHYMADLPAYWIGKPLLVVNSNVSWARYGPLFDLEQLPRTWDAAERAGTEAAAVDARRSNRLWLVELMWREIFENDVADNSPYFSAARVLTRLKHLPAIDDRVPELSAIYQRAYAGGHPAAVLSPEVLFSAWPSAARSMT